MFNEFFNSVFNNSSNEPEIPGTHESVLKDLGQLSAVYAQVSDVKKSLCDLQVSKGPGPDGLTARLLKELSNEISEPFTKIMNLSLHEEVFPTKWKDANFTPVSKSDPKNVVTNYRGIALLSILSKTFEKCIKTRLYSHVKGILSHNQHGFRKSRSCVTQLLDFVHSIAETLGNGGQTDVLYLDIPVIKKLCIHMVRQHLEYACEGWSPHLRTSAPRIFEF